MLQIDYYFSTLSPYTYLAGTRCRDIARTYGAQVTYKPLDVMALFSRTGGTPPKDRHVSRREYRLQDLRRQAVKVGLPITLKPAFWPTNGAPASYAIIAAQHDNSGDVGALVHGMTAAVWAQDKDIAQDETIRECLVNAGFSADLADKGLLSSAEEYTRNLEQAVTAGVFGAPFFVVSSGERFWGQDKIDDLELHLAGKL